VAIFGAFQPTKEQVFLLFADFSIFKFLNQQNSKSRAIPDDGPAHRGLQINKNISCG
jgi:hypothetical protein